MYIVYVFQNCGPNVYHLINSLRMNERRLSLQEKRLQKQVSTSLLAYI